MTTIFVAWVVFPALICVLSVGCGLLLEQVSGFALPELLVLPAGFAVLTLAAQMATISPRSAPLGVPLVVSLAALGFMLGFPWRGRRPDTWAVGAGVGVFAAYAVPVVLSGEATFTGYIKLDDVSTFLAMTDQVMDHGRSLDGLGYSSYFATLQTNVAIGYPLATFMPLGVGHKLLGTDSAWLFQPCMALMAAMLSVSLYALTSRMAAPRPLRAVAAFAGGQAALLFGYVLWGGIKEMATAWTIPLLAALVPTVSRAVERPRAVLPLAVACAVPLGVLGPGGAIWVAPALVAALVVVFRTGTLRATVRAAAVFAGCFVVLALPTIVSAREFLSSGIVDFDPIANLIKPLNPAQVLGIWPVGDFRLDVPHGGPVFVLLAVVAAAAAFGVVWAWRRGAWEHSLFVLGALASCFLDLCLRHSVDRRQGARNRKPGGAVRGRRGRVPAPAGADAASRAMRSSASSSCGVLVSNVLQYHDAWLAPRKQLVELERSGNEFAGGGPALMTEYMPYGVRHFLRRLDGEGASELRIRPVALSDGSTLPKGTYADLDEFSLDSLLVYRTLVLRRSPLESRPAFRVSARLEGPVLRGLATAGRFLRSRPRASRARLRPTTGRARALCRRAASRRRRRPTWAACDRGAPAGPRRPVDEWIRAPGLGHRRCRERSPDGPGHDRRRRPRAAERPVRDLDRRVVSESSRAERRRSSRGQRRRPAQQRRPIHASGRARPRCRPPHVLAAVPPFDPATG